MCSSKFQIILSTNWSYSCQTRCSSSCGYTTTTPDPHAEKYIQWSPYTWEWGNPIRFLDDNGKDPREGNTVVKIDFEKSFIIALYGYDEYSNTRNDRTLYDHATQYHLSNTMIDPGIQGQLGRVLSAAREAHEVYSHADDVLDLAGGAISKSDNAYAWQSASSSKVGYSYLTLEGKNNYSISVVKNQSEKLGAGFKNTVLYKQSFAVSATGGAKMTSMSFFRYVVVTDGSGKQSVVTQKATITYGEDGKSKITYSATVTAVPNKE